MPGSTVFSLGNIKADSSGKASFMTDINVSPGFGIMNRGWIVSIDNNGETVACGKVVKHDAAYMRFTPGTLKINQGDNVMWTQLDAMEIHTVSFLAAGQTSPDLLLPGYIINPEIAAPSGVDGYNGSGFYNSGILIPGATYNLTFTEPGDFKYQCLIHDEMNMLGEIVVRPPKVRGSDNYRQTNLVSEVAGLAQITDANLVNSWGIAHPPTGSWWVADNGMGVSTLYNGTGVPFPVGSPLVVTIPPGGSTPTGIVFNSLPEFNVTPGNPARFIFVTEDGTIAAWNSTVDPTNATLKVNNSPGAVYKGATIARNGNADFLYVANFETF
jgi:plastocyanin